MSATKTIAIADSYLALVKQFPLVPIKNEKHYAEAVKFLKKLAIRDEDSLDQGESDYVDALVLFVEEYQNKHHRIEAKAMPPLEALKYLMKESGMNPSGLGKIVGNKSLASQILKGTRSLSKANIVALAEHFHVAAGLFLGTGK